MKKIAILKSGLGRHGGLEKYTDYTARAFADRGCEVTILTSTPRDQKPQDRKTDHYRAITLGHRSWIGFKHRLLFDRWCHKWLKENPADLVFGMDRNTTQTHYRVGEGCHAAYLERRRQIEPFVKCASFAVNPLHKVNLWLEQKTFLDPHLQKIFTNSYMVREEVLEHYAVDPAKIHVVHNGVEWNEMEGDFSCWEEVRAERMRTLDFDPNRHQFLFIGTGWRRKGLSLLLNAIARLPRDQFHLSIVGREKYPKRYFEQIQRLGLEKNVTVFGSQPNIRQFLQMADTMVLPTLYDPFANVTVEALAMGVPVITSLHNGAKEILTDSNGTLIESVLSPEPLTEALKNALPKTAESARAIRESIRHLDFSSQLTKMIDLTLNAS